MKKGGKSSYGMLGKKHSEEVKQKIRISLLGHPVSKESRKKMGYWKGKKKKPLSLETKLKIANAQKGDKSWRWKGGITPINLVIRSNLEYKIWREAVFERDNWTCTFCGHRNKKKDRKNIHADHIKPFCDFPELRFAIDNGRTLCIDCHRKTDTYGNHQKKK